MSTCATYYTENLYPFQDGVLNIVKKSGIPCYLTGGTALSRGYFNHRYSDDLDDPVLGRLDGWRNILSNKLTAIFRFEPKDVVDLWVIARHYHFQWQEVMEEAKTKEAGVDPVVLFQILQTFPPAELGRIKWVAPIDEVEFQRELRHLANDILQGGANTLITPEQATG